MKKAFPWLPDKTERETPNKVQIKGKKVSLREKRLEDFLDDYTWRTDDELSRLDATRPIKMSYEEYTRYAKEEMEYVGTSSKRLAIDTAEGYHIGNCMYYDINSMQGKAELGIMIGDRNYWGKGYGTDAVTTLLFHVFATTQLTRIYLHTLDWNHRAQRSFEKAGFREVKKLHRSGQDFVLMEVLKSDWKHHMEAADGFRVVGNKYSMVPADPAPASGAGD